MYRPRLLWASRFARPGCRGSQRRSKFSSTKPARPKPQTIPEHIRSLPFTVRKVEVRYGGVNLAIDTKESGLAPVGKHPSYGVALGATALRDSCCCELCVDPHSGQKRFSTTQIPDILEIKSADMSEPDMLKVEWKNDFMTGEHVSHFPVDQLVRQTLGKQIRINTKPVLWKTKDITSLIQPFIPFEDWMSDGPAFLQAFFALRRNGLLILEGVPDSETSVLDIAQRIGCIQNTFYGMSWDVVSKPKAENVAYTNEFLCLHQDLLYMDDPPYIQVLHCLRDECEGGESLFSDGFDAAQELYRRSKEQWQTLCATPIPYGYSKGGHAYNCQRKVLDCALKTNPTSLRDVAWAPPFQTPIFLARNEPNRSDAVLLKWKKAATTFSDILSSPENTFEIKLKAGQCVLFNNRRILHGRRAFDVSSGNRWLKGTYVAKQTFISRLVQLEKEAED